MRKGKPAPNRASLGEKHNRLLIVSDSGLRKNEGIVWECLCDCGKTTLSITSELRNGSKKSCGCLNRETRIAKRYDPGEATLKGLARAYRCAAKRKNRDFLLSYEEFKALVITDCFYCGEPPRRFNIYLNLDGSEKKIVADISRETKERAWTKCNGVDRIDSNLGYEINNCVSCCYKCNVMKNKWTQEEFYNQVLKIAKKAGSYFENKKTKRT